MPAPPSRPENNRNAHNLANIQIPKPPTASYRPPDHMNSSQFQSTNLKRQPAPPQSHQMTVPPPGAEHPDVKFKVIPFFDLMDTIFKPLCLSECTMSSMLSVSQKAPALGNGIDIEICTEFAFLTLFSPTQRQLHISRRILQLHAVSASSGPDPEVASGECPWTEWVHSG